MFLQLDVHHSFDVVCCMMSKGGKEKNQIQSAYILSKRVSPPGPRPASSAPPPNLHHRNANTPSVTPEYALHGKGNLLEFPSAGRDSSRSGSALDRDSDDSNESIVDAEAKIRGLLSSYDTVMTPPVSVIPDTKPQKKKKKKHRKLLSFSTKRRSKERRKRGSIPTSTNSRPMMSEMEIREFGHRPLYDVYRSEHSQFRCIAVHRLTGIPGAKKAKGSEHYNVDEPYCIVQKVHVDRMRHDHHQMS